MAKLSKTTAVDVSKIHTPSKINDHYTSLKIQQHLKDINDVISLDDMLNIKTELTVENVEIKLPTATKNVAS